jgi:hypothetical protein
VAKPTVDAEATEGNTVRKRSRPVADGKTEIDTSAPTSTAGTFRKNMLDQIWEKSIANPELALVPIVLFVMVAIPRFRRRSPEDDLALPDFTKLIPSETQRYDMMHPVHSLDAEEFELLMARIYQLQGYRVSMPAALSGGHGGDFMALRKSERLLVQCKKLSADDKVSVDRIRKLHETAIATGATRGVFIASCGFTWDARNFAKSKGVIVINGRTLDTLITEARAKSEENLFEVTQWASKLMSKVQLTPPMCPTCEATMYLLCLSNSSAWVCTQRPECRGRRSVRKYHKPTSVPVGAAGATDNSGSRNGHDLTSTKGVRRQFVTSNR